MINKNLTIIGIYYLFDLGIIGKDFSQWLNSLIVILNSKKLWQ